MCVCFLAVNEIPDHPVLLLFNRDEFYKRPSSILCKWEGQDIIAGIDGPSNGTWMAADSKGRFAAITHFRDPKNHKSGMRSRGSVVPEYIMSHLHPLEFIEMIRQRKNEYNGFNIILGSLDDIYFYSQKKDLQQNIKSGIYGLSNGDLNSPWPKVEKGVSNFKTAIQSNSKPSDFLDLLLDSELSSDSDLPNTGVGYRVEKAISSIFVLTEEYGTKTSSLYTQNKDGSFKFTERTFVPFSKSFSKHEVLF